MDTVRDCFNVARDHEVSAEILVGAMDVASYAAGYSLSQYADALDAMADALQERAQQVRREARSR